MKKKSFSIEGNLILAGVSLIASSVLGDTAFGQESPGKRHGAVAHTQAPASLLDGFRQPPLESRPRTWWHWLDGNISQDGISKDLEWMKRIGLGGLQNFNGSFAIQKIIDKPVVYMSPEWKSAFSLAARRADELGLELAVAGSPGWSESGGPWVPPADGMKRLVWSEVTVDGDRAAATGLELPLPPNNIGPYQDLAPPAEMSAVARPQVAPFYADAAVVGWRIRDREADATLPVPNMTSGSGDAIAADTLLDGNLTTGVDVPRGTAASPGIVVLSYEQPQIVRSASIFIQGVADIFSPANVVPRLEVSQDGQTWTKVADITLSIVPTTISFKAVTARYFRFVFSSAPPGPAPNTAPGFLGFSGGGALRPTLHIMDLRLSGAARVNQFEAKAGFAVALDYPALDADAGQAELPASMAVKPEEVIDLTDRLRANGRLDWVPPQGKWRILRLGYALTGAMNHPAPAEATGLEVDKLDGGAVQRYLDVYLGTLEAAAGPGLTGRHGLKALINDSTEVGAFNWTPALLKKFRALRGYDPRPWLPALTGTIIRSRADSDRFLFDFRRTLADLHASEHYATIAAEAHRRGLRWYSEALEGGRTSPGDNMDMRRHADVPMGAMWTFERKDGPKLAYRVDLRGAASVAHVFGQKLIGAESMTSSRFPWAQGPADLRRVVDAEFAEGVNLPIVHTSVHQPTDQKPGLSMRHIGQFLSRNDSWAELARPWVDYMARTAFLLQQGRFVADLAYFYGEDEPAPDESKPAYQDVPQSYGYDYVNATVVRDILKVDGGDLVAPSGARYRALFLGGSSDRMTLTMLKRIAELVRAGATVIGQPPRGSPGLNDDPQVYAGLVAALWSGQQVTLLGKGKVIASSHPEEALAGTGLPSDASFRVSGAAQAQSNGGIRSVHRHLPDADIWFINNTQNQAKHVKASFRITGKMPEIWRADSGKVSKVSYRVRARDTAVSLDLLPEESLFVVFRKRAARSQLTVPAVEARIATALTGPWEVSFEAGRGAPPKATLAELAPLNEQKDAGLRYFSGIATYTKPFEWRRTTGKGRPTILDLGAVGDIAEIKLNGQALGTLWHAPYRVNLGSALREGSNLLEIRVANLWANRLIGDAQPGAARVGFTITPTYKATAPLRPSGLIGPVKLVTEEASKS